MAKKEIVQSAEDVNDIVDYKVKKNRVVGLVSNCHMLRLREGANLRSRELARIPVDSKVDVNLVNSTESFYEVSYSSPSGVLIGFCLKEFIKVD